MTPAKYKATLARHDISIVGAAQFFGISRRQAQRIASGDSPVPGLIAKVLDLIDTGKLKKEDLL